MGDVTLEETKSVKTTLEEDKAPYFVPPWWDRVKPQPNKPVEWLPMEAFSPRPLINFDNCLVKSTIAGVLGPSSRPSLPPFP